MKTKYYVYSNEISQYARYPFGGGTCQCKCIKVEVPTLKEAEDFVKRWRRAVVVTDTEVELSDFEYKPQKRKINIHTL